MNIRKLALWLAIALAISSFWTVVYYRLPKWTSTDCYDPDISPKGYYKVVFCHSDYFEDSGYVRLFDNRTGKLIAESDFITLSGNGHIFWPVKQRPYLAVGVDFRTRVEPEPED